MSEEKRSPIFSMRPIGFVRSPYEESREVPRGLGTKHSAEGILEINPELELGLTDIEGFSHLFVIWAFDRAEGVDLIGRPPSDDRPHGVFATRSPKRPNPIGLTVVQLVPSRWAAVICPRSGYAQSNTDSRYQALSLRRAAGTVAARLAGRSRSAKTTLSEALSLRQSPAFPWALRPAMIASFETGCCRMRTPQAL